MLYYVAKQYSDMSFSIGRIADFDQIEKFWFYSTVLHNVAHKSYTLK